MWATFGHGRVNQGVAAGSHVWPHEQGEGGNNRRHVSEILGPATPPPHSANETQREPMCVCQRIERMREDWEIKDELAPLIYCNPSLQPHPNRSNQPNTHKLRERKSLNPLPPSIRRSDAREAHTN